MEQSQKDAGTIEVLVLQLEETEIPRALRLLDRVNAGEKIRNGDIEFLDRVDDECRGMLDLIERNPEYMPLVSKFIDLYTEIIAKAVMNEKSGELNT